MSGSADKTVKIWDLRNTSSALFTIRLMNQVEDFVTYDENKFIIANGNMLSIANLHLEKGFRVVNEF